MYFIKNISDDSRAIHNKMNERSNTNRLVLVAIFSGIAAILQAAGGFLPGVGFFISPFATAPIIFSSILSKRLGFLSYIITNFLLLIIQPAELFVFPFTTGALGLGIGIALLKNNKRLSILIAGCAALSIGILIVLYGFKFPLLGPIASTSVNGFTVGGIILFSALYSWIWVEIAVILLKRMRTIFVT